MSLTSPIETTIDGRKYRYYDVGEGDTAIVFLHGLAMNGDWSFEEYPQFQLPARWIMPDLPGHRGLPIEHINSIGDIAEYVSKLVVHLGLSKVVFMGYSLGGLVSLKSAELFGNDSWMRATVVWASPVLGTAGITREGKLLMTAFNTAPSLVLRFGTNRKVLDMATMKYKVTLSDSEKDLLRNFSVDSARAYASIIAWGTYDLDPKIDTLLVYGTNDRLISGSNYEYAKKHKGKKVGVRLVEDGGHFGTKKGRHEAMRVIREFVEKVERS